MSESMSSLSPSLSPSTPTLLYADPKTWQNYFWCIEIHILFWAHFVITFEITSETLENMRLLASFFQEKNLTSSRCEKKSPYALRLISLLLRKSNWGIKETIFPMGTVKRADLHPPFLFIYLYPINTNKYTEVQHTYAEGLMHWCVSNGALWSDDVH